MAEKTVAQKGRVEPGSRGAGLDMSRNDVWAVAEGLDLRPLGLVSVDATWSAFRLRPAR